MKNKKLLFLGLSALFFPSSSYACGSSPIMVSLVTTFLISISIFIIVASISVFSSIKGRRVSLVRIFILVILAMLILVTFFPTYAYYDQKIEEKREIEKCKEDAKNNGGQVYFCNPLC